MRFIVDAQLPPALARSLVMAGHEADHVSALSLASASDAVIWDRAVERGAVIITKDEDFARRRVLETVGPAVVWIRLPNTRRSALIAWFDRALPSILAALERGEGLTEVV